MKQAVSLLLSSVCLRTTDAVLISQKEKRDPRAGTLHLIHFFEKELLAKMACATTNGPSSSRPNEIATVRYLRRAVAIERRWGGDLTGHDFWASRQRGGCTNIH